MGSNPVRKSLLAKLSGSQGHDGVHSVDWIGIQSKTVQRQKETNRQKPSPLVAVIERMVTDESKPVCSGQTGKICVTLICGEVPRTGQGRLQRRFVSQAPKTTVFCEAFGVQQNKSAHIDPAGLLHLAIARKTSRYLAMNSRPLFS